MGASVIDMEPEESIFISYSFRDRDAAESVCNFLEQGGLSCWIAPRDVVAGERYSASIVEAVQKANIVILMLSRTANGSEHVTREVCVAFEHGIRILPVRIEDVKPRGELIYALAGVHWLDLFPGKDESGLQQIGSAIRRFMQKEQTPVSSDVEAREFKELTEAAYRGDVTAQHLLGRKSAEPGSPILDPKTAAQWFRKAAEQGHAESAYQLARAYDKGDGVLLSHAEYLRWIREAAKLGDPRAQTKLGFHLLNDKLRAERATVEAAAWFEQAAERGSVDALYQISVLRLEGRGVQQSDARALNGFRMLAAAGHAGAQYYLAWMLAHGRATVINPEEAREWAERAADQGHERAAHLVRELGRNASRR